MGSEMIAVDLGRIYLGGEGQAYMSEGNQDPAGKAEKTAYDMQAQIRQNKQYVDGLKRGKSSGISANFGSAVDIFDGIQSGEPLPLEQPYGLGESVIAPNSNPTSLKQALAHLKKLFEDEVVKAASEAKDTTSTAASNPERPVIAVLMDKGKKKYLFADGSVEDA